MSSSRRRLGYGMAAAFGFPLSLVTFASEHFRSVIVWAGETLGFQAYQTSNQRLYPAIAGAGFVLAGVGLDGLYKRLEVGTTPMIATVWVGAALGLYGTADIYYSGEFFGWYAVPAAFVLLTFGLATMGRVALRNKTFGPLSFAPLAVTLSGGLWFIVLLVGAGQYRDVMRTSGLLVHVACWFVLGALIWADPGKTHPVLTADEEAQVN